MYQRAATERAGHSEGAAIRAVIEARDLTKAYGCDELLRIEGQPPGLRVLRPRTDGAVVAWVQDLCEDDPQDGKAIVRRAR